MSLFNIKPSVESVETPLEAGKRELPVEAQLHILCSQVATDYVRYVKDNVMPQLDIPKDYTIRDIQILTTIYENSGNVTSAMVARENGLDPSTLTRSVKSLKRDGFVETISKPGNKRQFLTVTDKGETLGLDIRESTEEAFSRKYFYSGDSAYMTEKEMIVVKDILRRLKVRADRMNRISELTRTASQ